MGPRNHQNMGGLLLLYLHYIDIYIYIIIYIYILMGIDGMSRIVAGVAIFFPPVFVAREEVRILVV